MPFYTRYAIENKNEASILQFIKTGYRIQGITACFSTLRTAGFDVDLLYNVTKSTASWVEYAHLAVHINGRLHALADDSVKLVLRCQRALKSFSFCGRSHTLG